LRRRAVMRIREEYLWDDIALKYEEVLSRIQRPRAGRSGT